MRRVYIGWALVAVATAVAAVAVAAPGDWLGAEKCAGECHPQILDSWRKTDHARATAGLGEQARSGRCLVCHATGEGAATRARLPGVQCEACHGPGAAYSLEDVMRDLPLARRLGLREVTDLTAVCGRCHRADVALSAGAFDAAEGWRRIAH